MVSATCTISKGDLPIKIIWLLNGKDIQSFAGIVTNRVNKKLSTLSIESVDASHSGEYSCVASNKAGNVSFSAYLHVNGIWLGTFLFLLLVVYNFICTFLIEVCICVTIIFSVIPQIIPFEFGEDEINSGEAVSATCSISKGDLPINIIWLLKGKNVNLFSGIVTNRVNKRLSTLSIESVDASHAGEYTCLAMNKAGNVSFSAYLHVNGT